MLGRRSVARKVSLALAYPTYLLVPACLPSGAGAGAGRRVCRESARAGGREGDGYFGGVRVLFLSFERLGPGVIDF